MMDTDKRVREKLPLVLEWPRVGCSVQGLSFKEPAPSRPPLIGSRIGRIS